MLEQLEKTTQGDMLLGWGQSEAPTRLAKWRVAPEIIAKVIAGGNLDEQERAEITRGIVMERWPLLEWFLRKPTDWFKATVLMSEVGAIHTIYFQELTLAELARNPTKIPVIRDFDPKAMRGLPILVGPQLGGPFCLIDGANRCCQFLRMPTAAQPDEIAVMVGICPTVTSWSFWR